MQRLRQLIKDPNHWRSRSTLDAMDLAVLRGTMVAVDAGLTGGLGGPLLAESLANVVAHPSVRQILSPRKPTVRKLATLSRSKLCAVIDYVEEHLDGSPCLAQMAAVAGLSPLTLHRNLSAPRGCNRTDTSSSAVSSGPGRCSKLRATYRWWRSRCAPASQIKANSPFISNVWSASRQDSSNASERVCLVPALPRVFCPRRRPQR
jgi:AraC-like DNA-binding protein